jgi:hypothetical protein
MAEKQDRNFLQNLYVSPEKAISKLIRNSVTWLQQESVKFFQNRAVSSEVEYIIFFVDFVCLEAGNRFILNDVTVTIRR